MMTRVSEVAIRVPRKNKTVACAECSGEFIAAGPTGHRGDRPICDRCVFEFSPQLGMVLSLVSVARAFGQLPREMTESSARKLAAFTRVYETFAAKHGSRRESPFPEPD